MDETFSTKSVDEARVNSFAQQSFSKWDVARLITAAELDERLMRISAATMLGWVDVAQSNACICVSERKLQCRIFFWLQQMLGVPHQVYAALQINSALQFLHRRRIVHRDVATRNCL